MRIGQVSKKYGLSIDTLYYYINYGLIVPRRPKGQYVFDTQSLTDLEKIIELKAMDFSLSEIHKILSLYRISGLAEQQDLEDLKKIYGRKKSELLQKKNKTEENIEKLSSEISALEALLPEVRPEIGLPVSMLDLLCCPDCGKGFSLDKVNMTQQYIIGGNLSCSCGYSATIRNGVILTPNENTDKYDKPDIYRKLYKDLPPSLISLFQRSYNWMTEKLSKMDLSNKVVLETYINAWFFMHNHQHCLDPKGKYIVVDKYPEMLYMYKQLMEKQGYGLDIMFIADSSTALPLKKGCVDLNIDYFAVNEHNFYHDTFLYDELAPFFNRNTRMLGTYFYFEKGRRSMQKLLKEYPSCSSDNFSLSYFLKHMGAAITDSEDCGFTTSSGANIGFSFHSEGEKMFLRPYLADFNLYTGD